MGIIDGSYENQIDKRIKQEVSAVMRRALIALGLGLMVMQTAISQDTKDNQSARAAWLATQPTVRADLDTKTLTRVEAVTALAAHFDQAEQFENNSAGAGTSKAAINKDAFSHFLTNLTFEQQNDFKVGNALFRKLWVSSPSSTLASDGLGPLFNSRSCQSCHIKDGRGHPPASSRSTTSFLIRLGLEPDANQQQLINDGELAKIIEPTYGGQFQDNAIQGVPGEGNIVVTYQTKTITLADGKKVHLREPDYALRNLRYGALHPDTVISPRIAPPMIGLGLIENISDADIIRQADPHDQDGDGISGQVSVVRDLSITDTVSFAVGRFGWKASQPTIMQQSSAAFNHDIGISNPMFPSSSGDCTNNQPQCRAAPDGVQPDLGAEEAPQNVMDLVTFYSQNLAVPARRDIDDPDVLAGKAIFYELGCASCHTPKYVTRKDAPNPAHQFELIWPYSDFLLHDMGDGLADDLATDNASGREWRTQPLWGIGLTETVNGHTNFLHDGRARNLLEAIMWHGGEAASAKDAVVALDTQSREQLLAFLRSL